jgi:YVTN family beta-propeller protein
LNKSIVFLIVLLGISLGVTVHSVYAIGPDTIPPTISITSPTNGTVTSTSSITISGTASDVGSGVANVKVSIDGGTYSLANGTTSWSFIKHGLAGGVHTINAKATDNAGNVGVSYDTNAVVGSSISVGSSPYNIAFDSTNGNLYVTNVGSNNVSVINGATNTVIGSPIPVGTNSYGVAFDSANGNLYVANNGDNTVSVISGATNTIIGSPIAVGTGPFGIAFDSANGNLYVANSGSNDVYVINGATNTVIGSPIPVGSTPDVIAFDSANGNLYVENYGSNDVSVINGATNTIIGSPIPVGTSPQGIAFDSANGNLYVANNGAATVSVINGATNTVIGSPIPVGTNPISVAFDSANGNLYVANYGSNNVSVINGATNTVIGSPISVGSLPIAVAFDSANGNLYVTNGGSNTVSIISTPTFFIVLLPSISLDTSSGPPGTRVTITGTNFAGTHGVIITNIDGAKIPTANLWVVDSSGNRVLKYNATSLSGSNGPNAAFVVGHSDFTTTGGGTTQNKLSFPAAGVAFDQFGNLWVADNQNARVLEYSAASLSGPNGPNAIRVIGQTGFTSSFGGTTQNKFAVSSAGPRGIAFDQSGNLWVADLLNHRVLEFSAASLSGPNGPNAIRVIGQTNFTNSFVNATQNGLSGPLALAFDQSGNLWVVDGTSDPGGSTNNNHRVLEYSASSLSGPNGPNAIFVVGQPDFTSATGGTTQNRITQPAPGIAFDSAGNLWIPDVAGHRVLEYSAASLSGSNGPNAIRVIGQTDFTHATPAVSQNGLQYPTNVAFDAAGNLWVTNTIASRVLEYSAASLSGPNGPNAIFVVGQSNFVTGTRVSSPSTINHLDLVTGLTFDNAGSPNFVKTITIPAKPAGIYSISTTDGTSSPTATYTVTPTATISPNPAVVNSQATISGSGFAPNSIIHLSYILNSVPNTIPVLPSGVKTDSNGNIPSGVTFTVPANTEAEYDTTVSDSAGNSAPVIPFNFLAFIALNPTQGHVGDTVTITGAGYFGNSQPLAITFDGTDITPFGATSNNVGVINTPITIPPSIRGNHTIQVTSLGQLAHQANFTVNPEIVLEPLSGPVGTKVTVTGTGFAANPATITAFTYDGEDLSGALIQGSLQLQLNGAFSATFAVPSSRVGPHDVVATDSRSNTVSARFTLTPSITSSPTFGPVGTPVTITGSGFTQGSTVTITNLDGSTSTVTATGSGTFSTIIKTTTQTNPSISATDGTHSASTRFYNSRQAIVIDHTKVAATLANFPVLVSVSNPSLQANARSDGADIAFTGSDGVTPLGFEIEKYTGASGTLVAWVKVPSLSSTSDTKIFMYYGDPAATSLANSAAVWDANYAAVYHLNQTSGGPSAIKDSTSNANHGTDSSSPTFGATGKLDGAINFNNNYVQIPVPARSAFTMSAWVKTTGPDNCNDIGDQWYGGRGIIDGEVPGQDTDFGLVMCDGKAALGIGSGDTTIKSTTSINTNSLSYVTGTWNGNNGHMAIYVNGVQENTATGPTGPRSAPPDLKIGSIQTVAFHPYFIGTIDEVEISNIERPAPWITTEYNNQNSPSTFYSLASPPVVSLVPTSGPAGVSTTITGSSFVPSSSVTIRYGTTSVSAPTDGTGHFSKSITVQASPGPNIVSVTDGANTGFTTFTISSSISLSPTTGPPGSTVSVTGAGFTPSSTITIKYDNVGQTTTPGVVTANTAGSFSATFAVPASARGTHAVAATDGPHTATTSFVVNKPAISLSPTSGPAGTQVAVSGSGYAPSSHVTILFNGTPIVTTPSSITTTPTGSIPGGVTFVIPSSATVGAKTVSAKDAASNIASATFTVVKPTITLNPKSGPAGTILTVTGSGFVFEGSVTVKFDGMGATPGSVVATKTVGNEPVGVAFDSANGNLYVSNRGSNTVSVINGLTNSIVGSPISVGNGPRGVAFDPANGYVYVTNQGSNSVSVINGATNKLATGFTNPIPVGNVPIGIVFDSTHNQLFVSHYGSGDVKVISGVTNTVVATIGVGDNPDSMAFDSANGYIYVTNFADGSVSVIDSSTNALASGPNPIAVGSNPLSAAFDPLNGYIYVVNFGSGTVSVIDGSTDTVVGSPITVGNSPRFAVFDSVNGDIYVTNQISNTVSVIDGNPAHTTYNNIVSTISVGSSPWGLAFDPANGYIYVANSGPSHNVSVVSAFANQVVIPTGPGSFTDTIVIPPTAAGSHTISAKDSSGNTAVAIFTRN